MRNVVLDFVAEFVPALAQNFVRDCVIVPKLAEMVATESVTAVLDNVLEFGYVQTAVT
jgi:hypothetical protein